MATPMNRDYRLLIVDDNAATRYAMRRVLERHGYQVLEAGNGTDGLLALDNEPIDALVLDVNLPDMSGFDIARRLRADERTALLPVIHVSAASIHTGDMVTGLDAGADAYLIHPVDPDVLLATLRTLLRVRDTELRLLDSEMRFREIFANIAAPVAVLDAQFTVHDSNPAFARLLRGSIGSDLSRAFEHGQEDALAALRQHLTEHRRWRGTLRLKVGDDSREMEWRLTPYREPGRGIIFVEDVTDQRARERQQLEELDTAQSKLAHETAERERAQAQLVQSSKMDALGKLTGGIAHDFNNLLAGIVSGVELMVQRAGEQRLDDHHRYAESVLESTRRAAALTHRLLAFARQQPLESRSLDINAHVTALRELLQRTLGEHIVLALQLADASMVARVDPNQLDNAIINLAINARDALPHGGSLDIVTARRDLRGDAELADGTYIELTVRDSGLGIPADVLPNVFEPFFTTKPEGAGTGLGLAMIYGFARQSGGIARIRSMPGTGTAVSILLPASALPAQADAAPAATPVAEGHGEHILVVDDVALVRDMVVEILEAGGYACTAVATVDDALHVLRGEQPLALLLTDVGLPGMSGRVLADYARAARPQLPVLFMTGYAEKAVEKASFLGENMDMIMKPFRMDVVLGKIRSMLPVIPAKAGTQL
jgi:DNA-binding response OmpR family regulator